MEIISKMSTLQLNVWNRIGFNWNQISSNSNLQKNQSAVQRYRMRGLNSLAITPSLQLLSLFLVGLSSLLTRWIWFGVFNHVYIWNSMMCLKTLIYACMVQYILWQIFVFRIHFSIWHINCFRLLKWHNRLLSILGTQLLHNNPVWLYGKYTLWSSHLSNFCW